MGILNRPSDGNVTILIAVARTLALLDKKGEGIAREKLEQWCAPENVVERGSPQWTSFLATLNTWVQLGFLVEDDNGIRLCDEVVGTKPDALQEQLPGVLTDIVLRAENNESLWRVEDSGGADFTRALLWSLAQSPYDFPDTHSDAEVRVSAQISTNAGVVVFQNDTRWQGFSEYARYLGFGWKAPKGNLVLDPSRAVQRILKDCFPDTSKAVPFRVFMNRLGERMPVFGMGVYASAFRDRISETWKHNLPEEQQVSIALSAALLNMKSKGLLVLTSESDAEQWTLLAHENEEIEAVSHVKFVGGGE